MSGHFQPIGLLVLSCLGLISEAARADPRRDLSGDPLPPDAIARMGTIRWRHIDQIGAFIEVVPSPTGELVATVDRGDSAKVVRVWDLSDGRPMCELPWPDTVSGRGLLFTADSAQLMILGPRGVVKFYDSRTGKLLAESKPAVEKDDVKDGVPPASKRSERWSETQHTLTNDGRWVVTKQGQKNSPLMLTEIVADHAAKPRQVALDRPTGDLAFHFIGDGNMLIGSRHSGQKFEILRWDVRTGKLIRTTPIQAKIWRLADWTRDGKRVALWLDDAPPNEVLRVWDTETGNKVIELDGLVFNWGSTRFSPDGKHLIANPERNEETSTVAVWDVERGKVIGRQALPVWCNDLRLLPDGKTILAVDSVGMMFGTWEIATGRRLNPVVGHESKIQHLGFSADGKSLWTASVNPAEPIMEWQTGTGKKLQKSSVSHGLPRRDWTLRHGSPSFVLSLDGTVVTTSDGTLVWTDTKTGRELRRISTKRYSPKDEYTVQEESVSLVIDAHTGRLAVVGLHTFGHSPYASVSAEDGWKDVVTVWDVDSGQLIARRVAPRSFPNPPALVSPDGRLLARQFYEYLGSQAPTGKTILIEPAFAGRGGIKLHPPDDLSPHYEFMPDSQTLITVTTKRPPGNESGDPAGPSSIRLWEARTGRQRLKFTLPFTVPALGKAARFEALSLAVSPDGRFLASAWSDNVIRLWELATGTEVATRSGYWVRAETLAFRPDGKALASGHADGTALVWELSGLPAAKVAATDRGVAWKDLASADAEKAYQAILAFAADPDGASFLRDRIKPAAAISGDEFQKLVKDLDHDKYATREAATAALKKLGELVEAELQTRLRGDLTAEQRRRIVEVLESGQFMAESDPDRLRALRCVEVLERNGTADARALLAELAKGAPGARLTHDAAMAIRRLHTPLR